MMKKILLSLLVVAPITSYAQSQPKNVDKEEIIYMDIAAKTKSCDAGVMRKQCLQVKTFNFNSKGKKIYKNSKWEYFYSDINGYSHIEGKPVTLKVKAIHLPNDPRIADRSNINYEFIQKL